MTWSNPLLYNLITPHSTCRNRYQRLAIGHDRMHLDSETCINTYQRYAIWHDDHLLFDLTYQRLAVWHDRIWKIILTVRHVSIPYHGWIAHYTVGIPLKVCQLCNMKCIYNMEYERYTWSVIWETYAYCVICKVCVTCNIWVMSLIKIYEACLLYMSHVSCIWVIKVCVTCNMKCMWNVVCHMKLFITWNSVI